MTFKVLVGPSRLSGPPISGIRVYRASQFLAIAMSLAHLLAIPVGITYDGHVYVDLAAVLGSSRFPAEWNPARTPLFPASLKLSFWFFGQQPLAGTFVPLAAGIVGVCVTGWCVRRIAGDWAGGIALLLLALFPTLIAYQHLVLTETGVFAFISCLVAVSIMRTGRSSASGWLGAGALSALLTAGYYWRPNLLILAPFLALLHGLRYWSSNAAMCHPRPIQFRWRPQLALVLQSLLIAGIPYFAAQPWRSRIEQTMMARMLRLAIVKQALPPPEDPLVRDPQAYRDAVTQSLFHGNLYSGIRPDLCDRLASDAFTWPAFNRTSALFIHLATSYPGRYLQSLGRTWMLFFGAGALENENMIYRELMLSPTFSGSKIGEGPASVDPLVRERFLQRTDSSFVLRVLHRIAPIYDALLMPAFFITLAGIALSLYLRDLSLFALCATPWFYMAQYALSLMAVDRYAFPVYPFVFAVSVAVCARILQLPAILRTAK